VGVDDGVGLRVRVCVTVAVVVAPGLQAREVGEVTVTVVGSLVGCVPGEVFPPRMESPVPPDSGPPLTVSTSVTVARLATKTTTAAAVVASTAISGRRDRRAAGVTGRPALGMATSGCRRVRDHGGSVRRERHRPVSPAWRTSRSAFVTWRRVTSNE
jgi:hypothetical protein